MKAAKTPAACAVSLDEIVFARKNRAYGAYLLRKHYARHMSLALFLSVSIFTVFSVSSIVMNRSVPVKPAVVPDNNGITIILTDPNIGKPADPIDPAVYLKENVRQTIKFLAPRPVVDDLVDGTTDVPTVDDLLKSLPSLKTQAGNQDGVDPGIFTNQVIPVETINEKIVDEHVEQPVSFAEVMPGYPGGTEELFSFISSNVRYPAIAQKTGVEGKVLVQFVVEKDGSLSRIEVVKSIGAGCDEEAVRVCKLMGKWHPGMQNGRAVRVKMIIPFLFRLQ